MARLIIPTPLRKFTGGRPTLEIEGNTVGEVLGNLITAFPDLRPHLLDDRGQLRQFVNIFVGEEDVRTLEAAQTPVTSDTIISIVPAIAGGRSKGTIALSHDI
ncbi:MAG: molybdopterin synthase sulfur carrier subunit [Calditrichaeota bacterium]|nr:MAG: molybdopterin synthase sulfur carrier subunit [Calditrichota bacterium]